MLTGLTRMQLTELIKEKLSEGDLFERSDRDGAVPELQSFRDRRSVSSG